MVLIENCKAVALSLALALDELPIWKIGTGAVKLQLVYQDFTSKCKNRLKLVSNVQSFSAYASNNRDLPPFLERNQV
jgi:hypothetical protein